MQTAAKLPAEKKHKGKNWYKLTRVLWVVNYALMVVTLVVASLIMVRQNTIPKDIEYVAPPSKVQAPTLPGEDGEPPNPFLAMLPPLDKEYDKDKPIGTLLFIGSQQASEVYPVDIKRNGTIGTMPSATKSAWYEKSAFPGQAGNCVMNGHVSYKKQKGIFSYLKQIEVGEEIVFHSLIEGYDYYVYYEVESVEEHPYNDYPAQLIALGGEDRLTLITCLGDFNRRIGTSETRVVAICRPIASFNANESADAAFAQESEA
ncbi:class F sortase [Eubacteriales bacterium OttesenSCG-928-K08]|nr:class F sortase [Eubacteriales bacterium OttesenSCG-928-K08]